MSRKLLLRAALVPVWIPAAGGALWSLGALRFDFPVPALRTAAAVLLALAWLAALILVRGPLRKLGAAGLLFAAVLAWWLCLQPSQDRPWQADVDRTAYAEIHGDEVTLHNVRRCEYRTETDFTPRWETRTVRLSQITGIDLAINYWGSPWMAHPIVSFQFKDTPPLCFSIETRKEVGESYSALGGLYRQFELIYVVSDERDVVRVRTNYRTGEDVFLYRTTAGAGAARARFLEYLRALNDLHQRPRWYNALTTNCTTTIRTQRDPSQRAPWDWRMLANGKGDEMLFERGYLATGGLPFEELKKRALINPAAKALEPTEDFSAKLREGRPGFQ